MMAATMFLLAACLQGGEAEAYYKLPKGTKLTYQKTQGGSTETVVLTVLGEQGGKVELKSEEYDEGSTEPRVTRPIVWYVEDGHLIWATKREGEARPLFRVYKEKSRKGDTWEGSAGKEVPVEFTAEHMGTTEVEVPAGKYKDALHIRLSAEQKAGDQTLRFEMDLYLVSGVGFVKLVASMGPENRSTMVLQKIEK